jgi:hypothetical protein
MRRTGANQGGTTSPSKIAQAAIASFRCRAIGQDPSSRAKLETGMFLRAARVCREARVGRSLVAALLVLVAGCASDREREAATAEQRRQDAAQAAFIAQQDDARCQSYAKPGSDAYAKCRASLKSHRSEVNAIVGVPEAAPEGGSKGNRQ